MSIDRQRFGIDRKVAAEFPDELDVSGIESAKPTEDLLDEDRYMLTEKDVMGNVEPVHRLESLGYSGTHSFEPFADALNG